MVKANNYFTALFLVRKTKLLKNGEASICLRITLNGQRAETFVKRSIELSQWDAAKGRARGKDRKSRELNHFLDTIQSDLLAIFDEMTREGEPVSAMILKRKITGEAETQRQLCETFAQYNVKVRERVGVDYVECTVLRHERTQRYLGEYINGKYNMEDIPLVSVNREFITGFEHFLKINKSCSSNTIVSYMKCFKKVMHNAIANKWLTCDPFIGVRFKQTKTNRAFLTEAEVQQIIDKDIAISRLRDVRDVFIFCCFTGLAFTDVKHLRSEHIMQDSKGEVWIQKPREKTNNMCSIPLLKIPQMILERHKDHPRCIKDGTMLPVLSNQRMNSYLGEIADICGITKGLTTHIARHSFACLALANNVSMASIAKMLGHADIRTTQIYARMLNDTVSAEMATMKAKF